MFKNKWRKGDKRAGSQQMAVPKQEFLANDAFRRYSCIHCRAHLADHDEIVSKLFQGNHGKAYLFNKVVNISCKQAVERELLTGPHAVADIYCNSCETTLGWKYEHAFVPEQKYKEGKYIIELVHIIKENNWDLGSSNVTDLVRHVIHGNNEITHPVSSSVKELGLNNKLVRIVQNNEPTITLTEPTNSGSEKVEASAVGTGLRALGPSEQVFPPPSSSSSPTKSDVEDSCEQPPITIVAKAQETRIDIPSDSLGVEKT